MCCVCVGARVRAGMRGPCWGPPLVKIWPKGGPEPFWTLRLGTKTGYFRAVLQAVNPDSHCSARLSEKESPGRQKPPF